ncbi:MAG: IS66 family transposase [Candidatus Atribacteria bacterium]|nr:IS66 family transposase [Candidatus Atribacteria bacterium]MBE3071891.1 IS66 family transposase [Acidobacteriota bacterium]MBE3098614.1 IS66 family transposase [Planctomycetota bacterium]
MNGDARLAAYERLRAREATLAAENAGLRERNDHLRDALTHARSDLDHARDALEQARAEIAELKRQLFGAKADRLTPEHEAQLQALQQDLADQAHRPSAVSDEVLEEEDDKKTRPPRRRRPPRHGLPVILETETVTIEPEVTTCPCCGRPLRRIGEEVTEETDLIPAKLIRRRTVRPKYACACGEAGVTVAPLPPRLIPQSTLGLGLATHVVLSRFDDHLSFYRLEQQFWERHGVAIPRQQMVQWVKHLAEWVRPIYDAMWRDLLATGYLQVDETPVRVLDPDVKGKAARGYLWFYAVPGGDVLLEFDRHRSLDPVQKRLKTFVGTIQTDAYKVYQALERKEDGITRIGCLAHARRRYYVALREHLPQAVWFISQIRLLYRIEDEARDLTPAARHALRHARAPAIWEALKARAEELRPIVLPKSTMGKAVGYFLEEYPALIGYLRDGRFEIDNNLVENDIRPTAVGRRRWLFIGHPDAGWRSAVIYSLIVSCRRRGINPEAYFTDILRRLPETKITQIASFLPANWSPPISTG